MLLLLIVGVTNATYYTGRAERLMHIILNDPDIITGGEDVVAILNPGRMGHSMLTY